MIPLAVGEDGRFLSAADSAKLLAEGPVPERIRRAEPESQAVVPLEISPGRADVVFPSSTGRPARTAPCRVSWSSSAFPTSARESPASAIGMDKAVFKSLLAGAGIPTPRFVVVRSSESRSRARERVCGLPLPLFVKPATGGSSVGVGKVKDLERSRRRSDRGVPLRRARAGRGGDRRPGARVRGARRRGPARLGAGRDRPGHEFYDYDDKYRDDKAKLLIPAPVSEAVSAEIRRLAVESFRLCGISGMARVDFFLERGTDRVLVNELNTLPGFTAISMYPKLWEASGLPLPALLDELIRLALERRQRRDRLSHKPPAQLA